MRKYWDKVAEYAAMLGIWLAVLIFFGLFSENFLTARTLGTLANRVPTLTVVAVGMTFVLIIGGIDLSVGSVLGLAGSVLGVAMINWHWPFLGAGALAMAVGLCAGLVNGIISVKLSIPPFIVTLGMLEICRGLSYMATSSQTKYIGGSVESLSAPISGLGISMAFLVALAVTVLGQILLRRTVWGRLQVAIGTNESAVRLAGVNPHPSKVAVYVVIGLLTGLGAVFYTSRLGSADPNAGVGLELSAIAAVVIGGTSLMGGRGSVVNSFFGVLIIVTLEAGLAQVGASEPVKRIVTGGVIIVAVIIDAWRRHLTGTSSLMRRFFRQRQAR